MLVQLIGIFLQASIAMRATTDASMVSRRKSREPVARWCSVIDAPPGVYGRTIKACEQTLRNLGDTAAKYTTEHPTNAPVGKLADRMSLELGRVISDERCSRT